MKIQKLKFPLLVTSICLLLISCERENVETEKLNTQEMLSILEQSGVNLSTVEVKNNYFLVEGDIRIDFESIPEIKETLDSLNQKTRLKAYKYPNPYYATISSVNTMKVYIDPTVTSNNWASAVQSAIDAWNNISPNCAIKISTVSSSSLANTVISTYNEVSDIVANGAAPVSGNVGRTITINTRWNSLSELEKINTITHEMGHTLGFAHSNGTSNFCTPLLINSTSSNDNSSAVMHMFAHSWNGFIQDEINASSLLYPNTANIVGASSGYNGESLYYYPNIYVNNNVYGPFSYKWEISEASSEDFQLYSTSSSVWVGLSDDVSYILRLTMTSANGYVMVDWRHIANKGDNYEK